MGALVTKKGSPGKPHDNSDNIDTASLFPTSVPNGEDSQRSTTITESFSATTQTIATAASAGTTEDNQTPAVAVREELDSVVSGVPCLRTYLVLGRLFKLHPDFDAVITGVLAGDADGCVVLIHETRDEEWTRAVWSRLGELLVPLGNYVDAAPTGIYLTQRRRNRSSCTNWSVLIMTLISRLKHEKLRSQ